jgi:hypothetical protein
MQGSYPFFFDIDPDLIHLTGETGSSEPGADVMIF